MGATDGTELPLSRPLTEASRLAQSAGVHNSWARTPDRAARTAPARAARWQQFIDQARELAPPSASQEDIERRAHHLQQAHLKRAAAAAIKARQAKAKARRARAREQGVTGAGA